LISLVKIKIEGIRKKAVVMLFIWNDRSLVLD